MTKTTPKGRDLLVKFLNDIGLDVIVAKEVGGVFSRRAK